MKALRVTGYGSLEGKLAFIELPVPTIGDDDMLIACRAARVNPHDVKLIRGDFKRMKKLAFPYPIGGDVSGVIVKKGKTSPASMSGLVALPFVGAYSVSKYVVESLTDALRRELDIYGIDVVSISPGIVKTPIGEKIKDQESVFAGTDYAKYEAYNKN